MASMLFGTIGAVCVVGAVALLAGGAWALLAAGAGLLTLGWVNR